MIHHFQHPKTVLFVSKARLHNLLTATGDLADDADRVLSMADRAVAAGHPDIAVELTNLSWRLRSTAHRWFWFVEDSLETPAPSSKTEGAKK